MIELGKIQQRKPKTVMCCPQCGQRLPAKSKPFDVDLGSGLVTHKSKAIQMPRREARLIDALSSSYPRALSIEALLKHLYTDNEIGSLERPEMCVHTFVSKARKMLKEAGMQVRIVNDRFLGYRIEVVQ